MTKRIFATLTLVFALAVLSACGKNLNGPTSPNDPNAPPKWTVIQGEIVGVPATTLRPSGIKTDILYLVNQSGLDYQHIWSVRYPDGHEEEFSNRSGQTQVPVLTQSGTFWSVRDNAKLGDYAIIFRMTERFNGLSNTSFREAKFTVVP
jgi:predicted small lipoprotein YifL